MAGASLPKRAEDPPAAAEASSHTEDPRGDQHEEALQPHVRRLSVCSDVSSTSTSSASQTTEETLSSAGLTPSSTTTTDAHTLADLDRIVSEKMQRAHSERAIGKLPSDGFQRLQLPRGLPIAVIARILHHYTPHLEADHAPLAIRDLPHSADKTRAYRSAVALIWRHRLQMLAAMHPAFSVIVNQHPSWPIAAQWLDAFSPERYACAMSNSLEAWHIERFLSFNCVACIVSSEYHHKQQLSPVRSQLGQVHYCDEHAPDFSDEVEVDDCICCHVCFGTIHLLGDNCNLGKNTDRATFPFASVVCCDCRLSALRSHLVALRSNHAEIDHKGMSQIIDCNRDCAQFIEFGEGSIAEVLQAIEEDIWLSVNTSYLHARQNLCLRLTRDLRKQHCSRYNDSPNQCIAPTQLSPAHQHACRVTALEERCVEVICAGSWMSPKAQMEAYAYSTYFTMDSSDPARPVYKLPLPSLPPTHALLRDYEKVWHQTFANIMSRLCETLMTSMQPHVDRLADHGSREYSELAGTRLLQTLASSSLWRNTFTRPDPQMPVSFGQVGQDALRAIESIWADTCARMRDCPCSICVRCKRKRDSTDAILRVEEDSGTQQAHRSTRASSVKRINLG